VRLVTALYRRDSGDDIVVSCTAAIVVAFAILLFVTWILTTNQ
jgi:hypothetical protein